MKRAANAAAAVMVQTNELVPWERNPRHNAHAVDSIARSIQRFGFSAPIVARTADKRIIAGHTRWLAARKLGLAEVPVRFLDLSASDADALAVADNKLGELASWDDDLLSELVAEFKDDGMELDALGFSEDDVTRLLGEWSDPMLAVDEASASTSSSSPEQADTEADDVVPEVEAEPVSADGDVWVLGRHRVMCGDSTGPSDVARLMAGARGQLLHADPPYGMGKAADGVANDNLYREKLDEFQMDWWRAFRPHLDDNASAYIWGNAADLWRLWYLGGLGDSERLDLRNEIVWDKSGDPNPTARVNGLPFKGMTSYFSTERCLFFQFGNQFLGNVNSEDFPETWEPLRSYMEGEAKAAGMKPSDVKRVCGCGMFSHWFTRSQFSLIPERHYRKLAAAYPGQFTRDWSTMKSEWESVRGASREVIHGKLDGARSYFDNTHDGMTDVWKFFRVTGEDRHGHATPKPVAMMERAIKSSCPPGGIVVEPFGGSGSTLIGAEKTDRVCFTMEMQGKYVDVIVRRWQAFTGKAAVLEATGQTFDEVERERSAASHDTD